MICVRSSFGKDDVVAFSEGRAADCFGTGFDRTQTHTRTPKIQAGRQLFIDEVTQFDPGVARGVAASCVARPRSP